MVYYYDPTALQASSPSSSNNNNGETEAAPELTLPETVYDSSGHAMKLEQLHAGGKNEIFLEVQPKSVWGNDLSNVNVMSGMKNKLASKLSSSGGVGISTAGFSGGTAQSQDQLIVLFTVATMAIMVGALSAKRLRSRKLLESCMHPELEEEGDGEDWEEDFSSGPFASLNGSMANATTPRYDKKFDGDGGSSVGEASGFGALLGGRRNGGGGFGGNYGTSDVNGGLHWRGDMEKFDV